MSATQLPPDNFDRHSDVISDSALLSTNLMAPVLRCVEFQSIACGDREIAISHHGQIYRLKLTRNDRLILQK